MANPSVWWRKIIFQANEDGTYNYWYWYEPDNTDPVLDHRSIMQSILMTGLLVSRQTSQMIAQLALNREAIKVDDRSTWTDSDCSADRYYANCDIYMPEGMKPIGDVTGLLQRFNTV
ncbi:MAG: hypothetical protein R2883_03195 [Caldisericia bacterium]